MSPRGLWFTSRVNKIVKSKQPNSVAVGYSCFDVLEKQFAQLLQTCGSAIFRDQNRFCFQNISSLTQIKARQAPVILIARKIGLSFFLANGRVVQLERQSNMWRIKNIPTIATKVVANELNEFLLMIHKLPHTANKLPCKKSMNFIASTLSSNRA